jgi:hypothetical protein
LFVRGGFVRSKESQYKFDLKVLCGGTAEPLKVEVKTGNDPDAAASRRDQLKQLESLGPFVEDRPPGDIVARAPDPQLVAAGMPRVAKTHLQEVHDLSEFAELRRFIGRVLDEAADRIPATENIDAIARYLYPSDKRRSMAVRVDLASIATP